MTSSRAGAGSRLSGPPPLADETIDVLLAVYNGAGYLDQQLDSLARQSVASWSLIARDDGSTDASRSILSAFQARHPEKTRLIFNDSGLSGTLSNFSALLERSAAPYAMFCDQDDVWLPDKIERTLQLMRGLERDQGRDCPLLVHTDMKVVDAGLQVVAESLWRFQGSDPDTGAALNRLLLQNCATGCSMMVNRALRDLALPVPPDAVMHDWWLALVASAFGRIGHEAEPTLLYRQHGANDVGAREWGPARLARALLGAGGLRRLLAEREHVLRRVRRQAGAFCRRYAVRLSPEQREMVATFAALDEYPCLRRKWYTLKHRFFYAGIARNLVAIVLR